MSIADLEALEAGWRPPTDGELERLADAYGMPLEELLPPRTPIVVDPDAGTLGIGSRHAPLSDTREDALSAYLDMIYEARSVPRGEKIPLRDEDLDVLAGLVGDDPDEVEAQLIELMDYTPEEARRVRALLFRRKVLAGAAGVVLSLGAAGMMLGQSRAPGTPVAMEDAAAEQSSDPAAGFTPWGAPAGPPSAAPANAVPDAAPLASNAAPAGEPAAPAGETPSSVTPAPRGIDIGTALVIVAPPLADEVSDVGDAEPPGSDEAPSDLPGGPGVDTGGGENDTTGGGGGNDNPGGGGNDNPGGGGNDNPGGGGAGNAGGGRGNQSGNTNGQGWGVGGTPPAGQQPAGGPHSP